MVGSNEAGVSPPVISLESSSKEYPMASFAAIFAIGNPVAFDANADDLDTLGFISITIILPLS